MVIAKIKLRMIEKKLERKRRKQVKQLLACFDKVMSQGRKEVV